MPRLLWTSHRRCALVGLFGLIVAQVLAETATLVVVANLVDRTINGTQSDSAVAPLLLTLAALYLLRFAVAPISVALSTSLDWHLRATSGARLLLSLPAVSLSNLEEPEWAARIAQVRGVSLEAGDKRRAVTLFAEAVTQRVRLFAVLAIVATFLWLPAVLLLIGAQVFFQWTRREVKTFLTGHRVGTEPFRRAAYLFDMSVDRAAAKEVRLFGLGDWLVDHFRAHQRAGLTAIHHERRPAAELACVAGVASLAIGAAFGLTVDAGRVGIASPAAVALICSAILVGAASLITGEGWVWDLGAAPYARLLKLEDNLRDAEPAEHQPAKWHLEGDIELDGLGFRYRQGAWILRDLSLTIRRGRSLAIVGRNGAGKTTLVKLLCGLYEPTEGSIRLDGRELTAGDFATWAAQVAVVFQDFARYPLTVQDNVTMGRSSVAESDLEAAIARTGLRESISLLPLGLATPLSRDYPGGTDLSGGEWQRVALARAMAAIEGGAALLVLDEPTASLDVETEASFNEQLLSLVRGTTTVIVSHRFPTVRRADSIAVIDNGRVLELGSHDELIASGGLYARLYATQAAHFGAATRQSGARDA